MITGKKGKGHNYVTVFTDIERPRGLEVAQGREEEAVTPILNVLPNNQKQTLKAAVIDMWESYLM